VYAENYGQETWENNLIFFCPQQIPSHKSGFYLQQSTDNADGKTKPHNHYNPVECFRWQRQSKNAFALNVFPHRPTNNSPVIYMTALGKRRVNNINKATNEIVKCRVVGSQSGQNPLK